MTLARLLRESRDDIVHRFITEVKRKDLPPRGVTPSILVDHIPSFLDEVLDQIDTAERPRYSQDAIDTSQIARRHGHQRWVVGYDLEALVREYGILRHAIVEAAVGTGTPITVQELETLAKCVNVGVAEAVSEFVRNHEREIRSEQERVELIARAGELLSSSLDRAAVLARLIDLVVPAIADWCAVAIDGVDVD